MGMYIYKVTAQKVKLSDGREANVAVYAYKPYRFDDAANSKMHFKSGCTIADHWANAGKRTGLVVGSTDPGSPVWECSLGSFYDDVLFGNPGIPDVVVGG